MKDTDVISVYTLNQAVEDGVLVELFKPHWEVLSGGKPIVATAALFGSVTLSGLLEIWNEFVDCQKKCREIAEDCAEGDSFFETRMNGRVVWVTEDAEAFTLMYPEDY